MTPRKRSGGIEWNTQRILGVTVAGVGLVSVVVGAAFGLAAKSKLDESNAGGHCLPDNRCNPMGLALRSDSNSAAIGANVGITLGMLALAGGALLFFTAPRSPSSATAWAVSPSVGLGAGSIQAALLFR